LAKQTAKAQKRKRRGGSRRGNWLPRKRKTIWGRKHKSKRREGGRGLDQTKKWGNHEVYRGTTRMKRENLGKDSH